MNGTTKKQLSIVIAVDDSLIDSPAWFRALSNQTLPTDAYEVFIVDSSHTTTHQAEYEKYRESEHATDNISYHRIEKGGRPLSLNYGLDLASADVIVFLGDDCEAPPNFAEAHLRFHQTHPAVEAVAIGSALFPSHLRTPFSVWLEQSGRLWGVPMDKNMTTIADHFFYAANSSAKRALLERAGRLEERFAHHAWDDFEFGERLRAAGMRSEFLPEASVLHMHWIDLPGREAMMRLAGAAARVYREVHPGSYPWSRSVDSAALMHSLRVGRAYLQWFLTRKKDAQEFWWMNRLDAAFAEGYRHSERLLH